LTSAKTALSSSSIDGWHRISKNSSRTV
jgi:hypothetical protein